MAPGAITGDNVANHSLTVSDLAGASVVGPVSFSLTAQGCGYLNHAVAGAKVGQAAFLTWVGTGNPTKGVVLCLLKVVATGQVVASACNFTAQNISNSGIRVRVITLS